MSTKSPAIDLDAFARPDTSIPPPRRRILTWLIPFLILVSFVAIFWNSALSYFEKPAEVTVVRPKAGALRASGGSVLFQAAGWVEPDPFPISIPALTEGTVEEVLVQESDVVKKGDVVARLIPDHHNLERTMAKKELEVAEADRDRARAEYDNAVESLQELIAKREAFEVSRDRLKELQATQKKHAAERKQLESGIAVAKADLETQKFLQEKGADGPWQVQLAASKLDELERSLLVIDATLVEDEAKIRTARTTLDLAARDRELALEENLRVSIARSALAKAEAQVGLKEAALGLRELACERLEVKSSTDGVVLSRLARAGSHVGPEARDADICTLFDPEKLRVRVDVPQGQIGLVFDGQKARITVDSRRESYRGEVIRVVQRADIQKVTLEVQIRVIDPDALIRPEMLGQVVFLAAEQDESEVSETTRTILIPRRLVDGSNSVWVVDGTSGKATKKSIATGSAQGDWIPVESGLNLTDKLIDRGRDSLKEGQAIIIKEEGP